LEPSAAPVSTTVSGGLAAVDVITAMLRHVRTVYRDKLEQHRQWLCEAHFSVIMANADGTPDEDLRMVFSGDRAVDNEYALVVPRPEYAASAFASHRREHRHGPSPVRMGVCAMEVIVRHEGDDMVAASVSQNVAAASGRSPAGPSGIVDSATRHYTVSVLADLQLKQLPNYLCQQLFLSGVSPPRDASASMSASQHRAPLVGESVEEDTLTFHYNGTDVCVSRSPYFALRDGPPTGILVGSLTVLQLAHAGVRAVSFTTHHRANHRLRLDGSSVIKSLAGSSFESAPSSGSSFVENAQGMTATSAAAAAAAELWRVGHMDDIEALAYRTYNVRKRNDRKVWQHRLFSVDKDFVYNQLPEEQTSGGTKRPMRRIVDVESITVSSDDPKHCDLRYVRGPSSMSSGVVRDELEFESAKECKHFVTKIRILQRLAQQSATAPNTINASSPTRMNKQTVSQRFLNLFR
jgi:hypothetical protein